MKKALIVLFIMFSFQANGNWWLNDGVHNYWGEWYGEAMKVSGDDGTCYWMSETPDGLLQSACDLTSMSIFFYQLNIHQHGM